MSGIIKFAVKGVAAGIGLASESVKAHKERKAAREAEILAVHEESDYLHVTDVDGMAHREPWPEAENVSKDGLSDRNTHILSAGEGAETNLTQESLEHAWKLDEAQDQLSPPRSTSPAPPYALTADSSSLADDFLRQNPNPLAEGTDLLPTARLQLPVVIPQRRPTDRSRGFVRAYAPDLGPCGLTQDMFISFLNKFDESTQASPLLLTLNLAAVGLEFAPIPSMVGMLAAIGTHQASLVAMEVHARSK